MLTKQCFFNVVFGRIVEFLIRTPSSRITLGPITTCGPITALDGIFTLSWISTGCMRLNEDDADDFWLSRYSLVPKNYTVIHI